MIENELQDAHDCGTRSPAYCPACSSREGRSDAKELMIVDPLDSARQRFLKAGRLPLLCVQALNLGELVFEFLFDAEGERLLCLNGRRALLSVCAIF